MNKDVVPSQDKITEAADLTSTLVVNGPVLVDLVYGSSLTGDATITIVEQPTRGSLSILSSALLKYTPFQDFVSGSDHATYKVCVNGSCDTGRIDFNYLDPEGECTVTAVYDQASGESDDTQIVIDVLGNDIACDGQFDRNSLKVLEQPAHGEAAPLDGMVFYYPESGYEGVVQIVYSVSHSSASSDVYYGVVDVNIQAAQTPVTVTAVDDVFSYTYAEFSDLSQSGTLLNYAIGDILGNDSLEGLSYADVVVTITRQPSHGAVTYYLNDLFQWVPGSMFSGSDSFAYEICYNGQCSQAEVQITVAEPEGPMPVANADTIELTRSYFGSGKVNLPIQQIVANDDLAGLTIYDLTISVAAQPETAQVVWYAPDVFEFQLTDSFAGQASFTYQMCYGANCSEATVTVIVTDW